jgi:amino acid permease
MKNNDKLFPQNRNMLNSVDAVAVLLNIAIGTGWLRLGYGWRCGVLVAGFITVLFAVLSYYAIWMYIKAIALTKQPTFEEIWVVLYNKPTSYFVFACSMITTISCVMFYIQFLHGYIITLVRTFYPQLSELFDQYILTGSIITFFFVTPSSFIERHNTLAILSYIKLTCVLVITAGVLFWLFNGIQQYGFDPNGQMVMYRLDKHLIACVSSLLTAYNIVPLAWPSPGDIKNATEKSLKITFLVVFLIMFIVYLCVGMSSYFCFFDSNEGELLLNLFPDHAITVVMKICLIISLTLSCPILFNHGRRLVISSVVGTHAKWNSTSWFCIGFLVAITSFIFGEVTGPPYDAICFIADTVNPFMVFIIPSLLYLKGYGLKSWFHAIGAVIILIVGFCGVAIIWYGYFSS